MTESEWLECSAPGPLLSLLGDRAGGRKLRLFLVACLRQTLLQADEPFRIALEVSERYADGLARREELDEARGLPDD
jgi:hypothetical protein